MASELRPVLILAANTGAGKPQRTGVSITDCNGLIVLGEQPYRYSCLEKNSCTSVTLVQFYSATVYLKMTTRIATLPIHAESIMSAFPGRGVPETVEQPLRRQRRHPRSPCRSGRHRPPTRLESPDGLHLQGVIR